MCPIVKLMSGPMGKWQDMVVFLQTCSPGTTGPTLHSSSVFAVFLVRPDSHSIKTMGGSCALLQILLKNTSVRHTVESGIRI